MINKLECTCIEAYTTRKMRDPNCCACSCDHNDLVEQLAKANERVKELEGAILDSCSTYHFEPDLSQPLNSLKELLRINSKWTLDPEISSDANKFAIEQKIEALEALKLKAVENIHKNWIVNPMNGVESPGVDKLMQQSVGLNTTMIDSEIEQLRKEQDKC